MPWPSASAAASSAEATLTRAAPLLKDLSTELSTDIRASRSLTPGRALLSAFQPSSSDRDIPLTGDAENLWKTDDSGGSELPGLEFAHDCGADEDCGDAFAHENSCV